MTVLHRFFDALNKEEAKFIPTLATDNLGLLLRCAINELDWYYYNLVKTEAPSEEQQEQFYILRLGVTRLIKLALDARDSFDVPVITVPRQRELTMPVLEITSGIGMIQHGRRIAQTIALGVGKIEEVSKNQFIITLPKEVIDDDYYERAVLQHYNNESRRKFAELTRSDRWNDRKALVNSKLYELVYPFEKHFIGYGGDPLLDEYFFGLAYHEMHMQEGYDTFHYATQFGGIQFQSYMLALTFLVALCLRHERFAEALVKKEPSIRLENILTISVDTEPFIKSIRDAVNHFGEVFESFERIDLSQARSIFNVLSCGRSNTFLVDAPGSPLPLIIQSSETGHIRCLTGAHSEPVRFLLESLRYHYPKEYDNHQRSREASMQRAVRRVLDDTFNDLEYRENVTLRLRGRTLTDVDMVVLEKSTGLVILCQLKHQELYGSDLNAKRIRVDRLKEQIKGWFEKLSEWVKAAGVKGVRESLRLPQKFPEPSLYKLVISKHFSYPLKNVVLDDNTVYGNWVQFYNANAIVKRDHSERKIYDLVKVLKQIQNPPEIPTYLPEPTSKWIIDELVFVTRQEESEEK